MYSTHVPVALHLVLAHKGSHAREALEREDARAPPVDLVRVGVGVGVRAGVGAVVRVVVVVVVYG